MSVCDLAILSPDLDGEVEVGSSSGGTILLTRNSLATPSDRLPMTALGPRYES